MPTTRKRHSVTETEEVERALEPLRERGVPFDLAQLVVLGAAALEQQVVARERDDELRRARREQFLERTRRGLGIDVDVAVRVRDQGWTHE